MCIAEVRRQLAVGCMEAVVTIRNVLSHESHNHMVCLSSKMI